MRSAKKTVELNWHAGQMELAYVHAFSGARDEALEHLRNAESKRPQHVLAAVLHAALGEIDEAFDRLDLAFKEDGWSFFVLHRSLLFYVNAGPWFDPLRGDERFDSVLERMRFKK